MIVVRTSELPYIVTISGKAESGKDTLANMMISHCEDAGYKACIVHYADLLKYLAKQYFGWNGVKDEQGRQLLQHLGTDVVRANNKSFWVEMAYAIIASVLCEFDVVFIPDARFPNEIDFWKKRNGLLASVKVERPGYSNHLTEEQQRHPSETALENYVFDYVVEAENIEQLKESSLTLFEDLFIL